jgi:uncharacterized membrane protein SpoIIM required for sporulation
MREIDFLKKNSDKWKKFEGMLTKKYTNHPDELAHLYIEITDDLAYAQTFYPESKTALYLNQLAAKVHHRVYSSRKEDTQRLFSFWLYELPLLFRHTQKEFLYSFIIFITAVIIGILSAGHDDTFVRMILGDHYVTMTMENIERGDPFAVYRSMRSLDMFFGITLNNIYIALATFVAGIALSVGTTLFLIYNGVMLGVFHFLFFRYDLLSPSLLTVFIHGTLEISAIVIAGGAGLVLGNSLLFPKTYSRKIAFMRGAKKGIKIVIGLVPVFIIAGFLEAFITRQTELPVIINLSIILLSLGFVLWYFIVYPYQLSKK